MAIAHVVQQGRAAAQLDIGLVAPDWFQNFQMII